MKRVFAVLMLLCLLAPLSLAESQGPVQRFAARAFTYFDEAGEAYAFQDLIGKPVVINFLASWCGPCRMELPYFEKAFELYGDDITFLFVDLCGAGTDDPAAARELIEEAGYLFPLYYDNLNEAGTAYQIMSIPLTVFVDSRGYIESTHVGAMQEAELEAGIQALLR